MELENLHLRDAATSDLPAILDIYNHAILNTTSVYQYKAQTLEMRRAWMEEKRNKNLPILVAEQSGKVVGFASYGPFRQWPAYKYTVEHMVYVHPDFHGRGIAQKLLHELISVAKQNELHIMIAGIDADNAISIGLHQKLGFEEVAHFKKVGYKFGKWLDLVFMQLMLDPPSSPSET